MSDKMRWRWGDTNPVIAAVDADTVIEIGDLVYQDTNTAKPASMQVDRKNEITNRKLFTNNFLGVAMQRSRAKQTDPVRVATTGVFEFDCVHGTYELGNLMGVVAAGTETALENQFLVRVSKADEAIGRVAKRVSTPDTLVVVDLRSTVMTGGVKGV